MGPGRALNQVGALVVSRHVIEHPPSSDQLPPRCVRRTPATVSTISVLIGVMALIEVVLLAGPAFAVGARRQSRTLALIAANGGTPTQSRRVILAAVVIGGSSAGRRARHRARLGPAAVPAALLDTWFGPFQIRWHVLGIAAFGSAPSWPPSSRRGSPHGRTSSRSWPGVAVTAAEPALAVPRSLLLGVGIAGPWPGSARADRSGDALLIAGAAVVSVIGMIFLVPVVVAVLLASAGAAPAARYAVRDAARHRTRTVPAVAAVAATVAGVVALAIGNTSDPAQAKAAYSPRWPWGWAH